MVFVTTKEEAILIDVHNDRQIDIDGFYNISDIKACLYSEGRFYLLANKHERVRGFFLIQIDENDPRGKNNYFILKWKHHLEIGDADIYLLNSAPKPKPRTQSVTKDVLAQALARKIMKKTDTGTEIVICYKAIFINTFTILVIKLPSQANDSQ